MFLNMPEFSICLNENKYVSINLEYVGKCLKYNTKRYRKVTVEVRQHLYKREAHSELYQTSKMELLRKCLIWYYEYAFEYEYGF